MSNMNRIVPLILVTGVGIWNGMYVFEPAFREQKEQKDGTFDKQHENAESGASQEPSTQESVANGTKPAKTDGTAQAAPQQIFTPKDASGSGSATWLKGWGLGWPGSKASSEAEQPKNDAPPNPSEPTPTTKPQEKSG